MHQGGFTLAKAMVLLFEEHAGRLLGLVAQGGVRGVLESGFLQRGVGARQREGL